MTDFPLVSQVSMVRGYDESENPAAISVISLLIFAVFTTIFHCARCGLIFYSRVDFLYFDINGQQSVGNFYPKIENLFYVKMMLSVIQR